MTDIVVNAPLTDIRATTDLIQSAIDSAHRHGGGRVTLAPGQRFVCGSLQLRCRVTLHLSDGTVLAASTRKEDYSEKDFGGAYGGSRGGFLLTAEDATDIAITGPGHIDGQGLAWMDGFADGEGRYIRRFRAWRPRGIGFYHCRNIRITDVTIRDLPQWTVHLTACCHVLIQGVHIFNRLDLPNCDGIDPDRCHDVRIIGNRIEAGDDCIVLKNTKEFAGRWADTPDCSDIVVSGNTLISTSAALKIGTESHGDFKRIIFQGNIIQASHRAVAIQIRDSGSVEDVIISDTIAETRRFHQGWWGNGELLAITCLPRDSSTTPGQIRGVTVRGLRGQGENGVVLVGTAAQPLRDITLESVDLRIGKTSRWPGGFLDLRPLAGQEHGGRSHHPENCLYARHVNGLTMREVRLRRLDAQPWYGPGADLDHIIDHRERDCRWE